MLVAQNSLGPVCPVPLTVRGMLRTLSVLQRFNGRRPLFWFALQAVARHPKALDLGVDDPPAVLHRAAALQAKYKSDAEIWVPFWRGDQIDADDAARMLRLGQMSRIALSEPLTPEESFVCRGLAAENGTTVALCDCESRAASLNTFSERRACDRTLPQVD